MLELQPGGNVFTPAEASYLKSQLLARLATVAPDGTVQNSPVGFFLNAELNTFDIWGQRIGVDVVKHRPGADPSAVVFDGMQAAKSRGIDVLLIDTAGRLHTKLHLIEELKKIRRVIAREQPNAPHETLLVLDAITGQNGLQQARVFKEATDITGIVLTKLDGTAKGGVIISIQEELGVPVKYIGVGEEIEDLQPFEPADFVQALLGQ